ncbi:MAG: hypothetical protein Q8P79_03515 [Nanoarchaeota archaeon]|nr:hypothetical protein [Nanoarchaeota archaeon]
MAIQSTSSREIFNNKTPKYLPISLTLFFILTIFFLQTIQADVVSVNTGGTQEIAVTPDKYIEGFFSGTGEAAAEEVVTPPSGGGGGGAAVNINVTPAEFNINLAVNTTTERTIQVRNLGTSSVTVAVTQSNLGNHVILGATSLTIPGGQSVDLNVVFVALSEPGIFTGTITIGGKTVLVSLNVKTQLLLFDSNIIVLNEDYLVPQGDELRTRVTLIPLGDPERLDVELFFTIRDYAGRIYLTKSETMLVDRLTEIDRNFDTGALPLGKYVVGLELRYPNGVAPSSAHFEVTKGAGILGRIILYLISLILLILIIILLILIWKRRKKKEEENFAAA